MMAEDDHLLPDWIGDFFVKRVDDLKEARLLTEAAMDGLNAVRMLPEAMQNPLFTTDEMRQRADERKDMIALIHLRAGIAKTEVENGFPRLFGQATVTLWGSLETLILDLAATILANDESIRREKSIRDVQIQVSLYDAMTPAERNLYIVNKLDERTSKLTGGGINRFEDLLRIFLLGGSVDEAIKDAIHEFSHVRNVIVHRRGRADRRLERIS
jgi:hypothetical protein